MADHAGRSCDIFGTINTDAHRVSRRFVTITNEDGSFAHDDEGNAIDGRQLDTTVRGWKRFLAGMKPPVANKARRAEAEPVAAEEPTQKAVAV